ncbi:MAG TPA: cytochrome P450 [Thermoanaerobaculia bacterium]|nr:cytochrome P450 [Thermoanaerobaculia bacterium]
MATTTEESSLLQTLRAKSYEGSSVFWTGDDRLAVFDPHLAQQVNLANYSDLTLPDKLTDLLRGRASEPVSWKEIRAAWSSQLQRLSEPAQVGQLAARMSDSLEQQLDRPLDLVWVAQEACTRGLLPMVIADLPSADMTRLQRDLARKTAGLLNTENTSPRLLWEAIRTLVSQIGAGLAVRRELRGRATGRRPRQLDLIDPLVDLLPVLGAGRAVAAVTAVMTAIAGVPGAAAACLMYELTRRPDWAVRLESELDPISPARFHGEVAKAPARVAPATLIFVKETLRLWSPPLLLARTVRTGINLEHACLEAGQSYLVSPHVIHHDPRHWKDPESFDPDRWLPESGRGPCSAGAYVPFGFAPKACIGAGLATTQLVLLCHLLCTRYRIELEEPESVRIALAAAAVPVNFRGTITRR